MSDASPVAGWYYADGDPPGTQRYWDGATWQGEPQAAAGQSQGQGQGQPPFGGYEGQPVAASAAGSTAGYGPLDWWKEPWRKYADFSGRARRAEYWWFALGNAVLVSILGALAGAVLGDLGGLLMLVVALAVIVPALAAAVRRLHDTGRSGWWYLIILLPFFGSLILFIFLVLDSDRQPNTWGRSPKYG